MHRSEVVCSHHGPAVPQDVLDALERDLIRDRKHEVDAACEAFRVGLRFVEVVARCADHHASFTPRVAGSRQQAYQFGR